MLTYPFRQTTVVIDIPKKFQSWFDNARTMSVTLFGDTAVVNDRSKYQLRPLAGDRFAAIRPDNPPALRVIGEFDRFRVGHTLNNRFSRELNLIRTCVYGVSFPAPLAYVLRDDSLIHPGDCFNNHSEVVTLKALYSLKHADARCCFCGEPFI